MSKPDSVVYRPRTEYRKQNKNGRNEFRAGAFLFLRDGKTWYRWCGLTLIDMNKNTVPLGGQMISGCDENEKDYMNPVEMKELNASGWKVSKYVGDLSLMFTFARERTYKKLSHSFWDNGAVPFWSKLIELRSLVIARAPELRASWRQRRDRRLSRRLVQQPIVKYKVTQESEISNVIDALFSRNRYREC